MKNSEENDSRGRLIDGPNEENQFDREGFQFFFFFKSKDTEKGSRLVILYRYLHRVLNLRYVHGFLFSVIAYLSKR